MAKIAIYLWAVLSIMLLAGCAEAKDANGCRASDTGCKAWVAALTEQGSLPDTLYLQQRLQGSHFIYVTSRTRPQDLKCSRPRYDQELGERVSLCTDKAFRDRFEYAWGE